MMFKKVKTYLAAVVRYLKTERFNVKVVTIYT